MSILDTRTARVLVTILCLVLCLACIYFARQTLFAFMFAILFAYLLAASVEYCDRRYKGSHRRIKAIIAVYAMLFGSITILAPVIGPRIVAEAQHLSQPSLTRMTSLGARIIYLVLQSFSESCYC